MPRIPAQARKAHRVSTHRADLQRTPRPDHVSRIVTRFPHLSQQAYIPVLQDAGDRVRATYERDATARQHAAIGFSHTTGPTFYHSTSAHAAFRIGLEFPFALGRVLMVYRGNALAAYGRDPATRLHAITQALRIRGELCWGGLDPHMRRTTSPQTTP